MNTQVLCAQMPKQACVSATVHVCTRLYKYGMCAVWSQRTERWPQQTNKDQAEKTIS